jgi:hypothetical protein
LKAFRTRLAAALRLGLPPAHARTLAKLKTPNEIQDFVSALPPNFEPEGDTCLSITEALRQKRAHCIEGAFIAACALWLQGKPPLLMDLQARGDYDHVVTLFRRDGCWGAISKSNHLWLRWRDPVYRTLRELAMSYFHEYAGVRKRQKLQTLWAYSVPFDLRRFDPKVWATGKEPCWDVAQALDETRHFRLVMLSQAKRLRASDPIETRANELTEHLEPRKIRKNKGKRTR